MHRQAWVWGVFLIVALAACKKNTAPEIYLSNIANDQIYSTGDTILVEATVVDDHALSGLEMEIDSSFGSEVSLKNVLPVLSKIQQFPLNGQTNFFTNSFLVPDSVAAGPYRLLLTVHDGEGAFAVFNRDIILKSSLDSIQPVIDSLSVRDTVALDNNSYTAYLRVNDDLRLANLLWIMKSDDGETIMKEEIDLSGTMTSKNYMFQVPAETGTYKFTLIVRDWVNNQKKQTYNIVFVE